MAHMKLLLFISALSAVLCQAGTYLGNDGSSNPVLCVSRKGTSVSLPTAGRTLATSITIDRLTAATLLTHSAPPSSSQSTHGPHDFTLLEEHCMPAVAPIQSLPNEMAENLVSFIMPGLTAAFPNHTIVVRLCPVGFDPTTTANDGTPSPTTNVPASPTSTSKPVSFADLLDTLSNIVGIITGCIQAWFQFRNVGELRRLFLPRLAPLDYLIYLRHLPVLAAIAQGQANQAVAVARPAPVARLR